LLFTNNKKSLCLKGSFFGNKIREGDWVKRVNEYKTNVFFFSSCKKKKIMNKIKKKKKKSRKVEYTFILDALHDA
jgi:hypothetical protein